MIACTANEITFADVFVAGIETQNRRSFPGSARSEIAVVAAQHGKFRALDNPGGSIVAAEVSTGLDVNRVAGFGAAKRNPGIVKRFFARSIAVGDTIRGYEPVRDVIYHRESRLLHLGLTFFERIIETVDCLLNLLADICQLCFCPILVWAIQCFDHLFILCQSFVDGHRCGT